MHYFFISEFSDYVKIIAILQLKLMNAWFYYLHEKKAIIIVALMNMDTCLQADVDHQTRNQLVWDKEV